MFVSLESASPIAIPEVVSSATTTVELSPPPAAGSGAQWEMVIPKMVRTNPSRGASLRLAEDKPEACPTLVRDFVPPLAPPQVVPGLGRRNAPMTASFALSLATKFFLGGALAAAVAIPVLVRVYGPNPEGVVNSSPQANGWLRESSAPTGVKQPRQLILYRPSLQSTDCLLEFTWKLSGRPLGWTFRAKDKDNYYGMAIRALRPAPYTALSVEHFTVYHGIESPHSSKVLILAENSPAIEIQMEVTGATFRLRLAGKSADHWSDSRLASGGVGFLEQPDQPADVQSVRISLSNPGGA